MDWIKENIKVITDFLKELFIGFGLSGFMALIIPEIIHLIFIIIGGIVGTIVVHLTRRWVNKKFPS